MTNIAELLKDAPEGIKLYSPLFGEVEFVQVTPITETILVSTEIHQEGFSNDGCYFHRNAFPDAECLLFPSKDCRTWEGWKLPVKPKFKVGDWIITDKNHVWLVDEDCSTTGYLYRLIAPHGKVEVGEYEAVDAHSRLWTIADAKDGDVLYSLDSKQPFIYKVRPQFSQARGYCCINKFGEFGVWNTNKCIICTDKYIPATKEQRDLLFAKMKEAGYEWDADKKELKKIKSHYNIKNFQPFDKVLVRCSNDEEWMIEFYCKYDTLVHTSPHRDYPFMGIGDSYSQCIPFNDETKHLLGTTDMPSEEYINW